MLRTKAKPAGQCQWFLNCRNEATILVPHSILGQVACCERCADLSEQPAEVRVPIVAPLKDNGHPNLA